MRGVPASAWLVLGLQGFKLWLAAQLPLFGDEAFYWLESSRPALVHDDIPGLLPALIAVARALLGDAALAVRLPTLLASWLTLLLLYRSARAWTDARGAWNVLLLASLPPLLGLNGVLALPDALVNLAVVLCLAAAQQVLQGRDAGRWWLALGLVVGLLAHYRFALHLGAAALAVAALPGLRPLLRAAVLGPVLPGLALALAVLVLPSLLGDGHGLRFQFLERHPFRFQPRLLADPLLQAVLVSPLLWALSLWAGWRCLRARPGLAVWAGWGLAFVALLALLGPFADAERSRLHWPAPAHLALVLPLAGLWPALPRWLRGLTLGLAACVLALGCGYLAAIVLRPAALESSGLYPDRFLGARRLLHALEPELRRLSPDAPLVVDHALLGAQLEHELAQAGRHRPVWVLDHPHNRRHGRGAEPGRLHRALEDGPRGSAEGLLVVEPAALSLRERPRWLLELCRRWPAARWLREVGFDHLRKRYVLYRLPRADVDVGSRSCQPPVLGYVDLLAEARVQPGQVVTGWVQAAAPGLAGLRLRLADRELPLEGPLAMPSLATTFGEDVLAAMPAVGWRARLPEALPRGRAWLHLEARTVDRDWHPVAALPVRVEARHGGPDARRTRRGLAGGGDQGRAMPASRSSRHRAISGSPTSAVGSSLSTPSNRLMPRPSHLKLPAQSSGDSAST
ncbi:MAG: hypothetical protein KatS3mg126_1887 [Lysobacteraceae bacterium]|nr:MAG: hypothetical protein KatS3mg126_1887 [Xanthomonadaceae bacterium]